MKGCKPLHLLPLPSSSCRERASDGELCPDRRRRVPFGRIKVSKPKSVCSYICNVVLTNSRFAFYLRIDGYEIL